MSLILVRMKNPKKQKNPDHTIATFDEGKMGMGMGLGLGLVSLVWGLYFNNRHVAYNFGLLNFVCG